MLFYSGKQDASEASFVFLLGQALTVKLTDNTVGPVCSPYLEAKLVYGVKAGERSIAVQGRCSLSFCIFRFLFPSAHHCQFTSASQLLIRDLLIGGL